MNRKPPKKKAKINKDGPTPTYTMKDIHKANY